MPFVVLSDQQSDELTCLIRLLKARRFTSYSCERRGCIACYNRFTQVMIRARRLAHGGMLQNIRNDGPRTVPQIAHARTRQQFQKLVDDVVAEGLARFRQNPDHKRPRITALARKGTARFARIDSKIRETS